MLSSSVFFGNDMHDMSVHHFGFHKIQDGEATTTYQSVRKHIQTCKTLAELFIVEKKSILCFANNNSNSSSGSISLPLCRSAARSTLWLSDIHKFAVVCFIMMTVLPCQFGYRFLRRLEEYGWSWRRLFIRTYSAIRLVVVRMYNILNRRRSVHSFCFCVRLKQHNTEL